MGDLNVRVHCKPLLDIGGEVRKVTCHTPDRNRDANRGDARSQRQS